MLGRVEIFENPASLARHVAEWVTTSARATRGPVRVLLSGGSTPRGLYRALCAEDLRAAFPWDRAQLYFGDERFVPHDAAESNYHMAREALLDHVPLSRAQVFPIPVDGAPDECAQRYEETLRTAYGSDALDPQRPLFELTLLGVGSDGHTASLLPGHAVLNERERWVSVVREGRPEIRITLTYPALESSRKVAFLVTGREKAEIVAALRSNAAELPAGRLQPAGELVWFLDREAAQLAFP